MTSPMKLLKSGLLGADWTKVADAYAILTGELLDPPSAVAHVSVNEELVRKTMDEALTQFRRQVKEEFDRLFGGHDIVPARTMASPPQPKAKTKRHRPKKPARPPSPANSPPPDDGEHIIRPVVKDEGPVNGFVDDGTLAADELNSTKQLCAIGVRSTRRPPSKLVNAECKCGKKEKVAAIHVWKTEGDDSFTYRCNNCSIGSK